jgi:predicted dehydrogenase
MNESLRYALIGCGGFGRFCLAHYRSLEGLELVAVTDVSPVLARQVAEDFNLEQVGSTQELIARPDIDLIHLATPPGTHYELAHAALEAGKHVLCEKPLTLKTEEAARLIGLAKSKGLVLAVNLIMRYNPLNQAVRSIAVGEVLGKSIFASLINLAQDEVLPPEHWFWDPARSGAIFIEHGVHFFDLFEWWFGEGRVVSAEQVRRPGADLVDQVHCAVRYREMVLGTFYHGFHQMLRQDRQDWEVVFEKGVIRMNGWVPTHLEADVFLSHAELEALTALLPGSDVRILEQYHGEFRQGSSRHRPRYVEVHALVTCSPPLTKDELYGTMLRELLSDQLKAIRSASHQRIVTETNGISSLKCAVEAQAMADRNF